MLVFCYSDVIFCTLRLYYYTILFISDVAFNSIIQSGLSSTQHLTQYYLHMTAPTPLATAIIAPNARLPAPSPCLSSFLPRLAPAAAPAFQPPVSWYPMNVTAPARAWWWRRWRAAWGGDGQAGN